MPSRVKVTQAPAFGTILLGNDTDTKPKGIKPGDFALNCRKNPANMKGYTYIDTSVTPTTTFTTTENGTTFTIRSPCYATVVDGCFVKKNAGVMPKPGLSAGLWALVILLMSSLTSALTA